MLTLEKLMDEAGVLGLPLDKKRAIVREYAQVIMLKALYQSKWGKNLFFMGGTALRFVYGLSRFSEDLDFNAENLSEEDFKKVLAIVKKALYAEGFECEILERQWYDILIAKIKFLNILQRYDIAVSNNEKLMIKFETNRPKWKMEREPAIINMFGYGFSLVLMSRGALLAEKIHALLHRTRGRDIYDILFMLRKKFPMDQCVLDSKGIGKDTKKKVLDYINTLSRKELERQARQVQPFLFKEEEIDLVLNAKDYIQSLLAHNP